MTDKELIAEVAVKVMGWNRVFKEGARKGRKSLSWKNDEGKIVQLVPNWNPLENWNHTFDVVEKMMEDMATGEVLNLEIHKNKDSQRAILLAALQCQK